MSAFTLQPGRHLGVPYYAPAIGPARFYVESEFPIAVFAFDEANIGHWRANLPAIPLAQAIDVREFRQEIHVPGVNPFAAFFSPGPNAGRPIWYLVMVNYDLKQPSAVYYTVQS